MINQLKNKKKYNNFRFDKVKYLNNRETYFEIEITFQIECCQNYVDPLRFY